MCSYVCKPVFDTDIELIGPITVPLTTLLIILSNKENSKCSTNVQKSTPTSAFYEGSRRVLLGF